MTPPQGRRLGDISTSKITLRDGLLIVIGACSMYGVQLGAQWGLRSDIRDLKTAVDGYQRQQGETNTVIQRQIDDWRQETKLNRVNIENTDRAVSELKGLLIGAGIKGVPK
jgi:hypothetical protein